LISLSTVEGSTYSAKMNTIGFFETSGTSQPKTYKRHILEERVNQILTKNINRFQRISVTVRKHLKKTGTEIQIKFDKVVL